MARRTPRVEDAALVDPADTAQLITVGTPAWYAWLAQATTFAFIDASGRFTARKEHGGRADGYWRAYRKRAGKVSIAYLGKTADLNLERMQEAAAQLARTVATNQPARPSAAAPSTQLQPAFHTGTTTLLFIDIADSAVPRHPHPQVVLDVLTRSGARVSRAITAGDGQIFNASAGVVSAAFASPLQAALAVLDVHRALSAEQRQLSGAPTVRMALHTIVVGEIGDDPPGRYIGYGLLLLSAAHSGQILLSHVTLELIRDHLPSGVAVHDLGAYWVGDASSPEHLFQLVAPGLPASFPPLRPPARRPTNLLLPATPLIGRDQDVAAVVAMLHRAEVRLVTLTGPGGVGKTRLGLQVAGELRNTFADGMFFVDLAALRDAALVVPTIAHTLGVADVGDRSLSTLLRDYLATRQLLLLLDNFEQVLPGAAVLADLLANAPQIKLIVTSRAPLHLTIEHEFPVAPLPWEAEQSTHKEQSRPGHTAESLPPAVALFIQRAQVVKPNFAITADGVPLVEQICQRLDGLPLAIELAAAWMRLFSLSALLQRLDHRLALLTGGAYDVPTRHQTLRATIEWSYQLLDMQARSLLEQLAVFEGSFTLEAASAVLSIEVRAFCDSPNVHGLGTGGSGEASALQTSRQGAGARPPRNSPNLELRAQNSELNIVEGLSALVDQSLLRPTDESAGEPHFRLLDTIREYALERLEQSGGAPVIQQRHMDYYLALAENAEPKLKGTDRRAWLDRLDDELPNLRAALRWTFTQGVVELGARLASALGIFWDVRHRREGRDWLEAVLASNTSLEPATRAKTLHAAGWLARAQDDQDTAIRCLEESLALYRELGDERRCTAAMTDLGWTLATGGGDTARASALLNEGLARYRAQGDQHGMARALHGLGWVEQRRALGERRGIAWSLTGLGWVEQDRGRLAKAHPVHGESLDLARAARDAQAIAWALQGLGVTAAAQRDYPAARTFQAERLAIERTQANRHGIAAALQQLGIIAFRQGDYAAARAWLAESLELARANGDKNIIAFTLRGLGEVAYAARDHARAWTLLEEALTCFHDLGDQHRVAQVYALLAQVALDRQDDATARRMATQSMDVARTVDNPETISLCLAGMADSAARHGRAIWAAQLWGAAERQREVTQAHRVPVEPVDRAQLKETTRSSLDEQAFAAAWAAGRALTPEEALAAPETIASGELFPATSFVTGRSAPTRPAGLTQRELEVLLLVAEALTNAGIAERLVISVATVKTYLSAIYRKLGVSSRTAAMRYVIDHHLQELPSFSAASIPSTVNRA
jgi:predicted ATPase/DNA-binding CsgD family transcriptional regulator